MTYGDIIKRVEAGIIWGLEAVGEITARAVHSGSASNSLRVFGPVSNPLFFFLI